MNSPGWLLNQWKHKSGYMNLLYKIGASTNFYLSWAIWAQR